MMGKSSHFQAEIPVYNLETRPNSAIVKSQMKRIILFAAIIAGLAVWLSGCSQLNPGAGNNSAADREADERTIRNLDADWSKAATAKDIDKVMFYYTDDATIFVPNEPMATGKPSIRVEWTKLVSSAAFALSFAPSRVDVSKSGDMAYEYGTYSMTVNDPEGKPVNDRGKYVVVWKKQSDGNWKAVADIMNSDLPLTASAQPSSTPAQ